MNKLTTAAILSLAGLGLSAADAFAWGCCTPHCCVIKHKVCCTQYNAFSPWCCTPMAPRHGKHCCPCANMMMSGGYQCPAPCQSGCQTGCDGGAAPSPGVPPRMPGATASPEMIPNAPMPNPAQTMMQYPGVQYVMMPQGGMPYPMPPMMQAGMPMPPMMGYPNMPMNPMMAQGMPMMPPMGYPGMAPQGYYPAPNQALIAPPGTIGTGGYPTSMPMMQQE